MRTALLEELARLHFPAPPASEADISSFERRMGWQLDADLRAFYLRCNGARLFRESDPPYWILPLEKVVRTRVAIYGTDSDEWGPASSYVLCDVGDTDFVSLDCAAWVEERYPLFDSFHETFRLPGQRPMIARSFVEFLRRALSSHGQLFWLSPSPETPGASS